MLEELEVAAGEAGGDVGPVVHDHLEAVLELYEDRVEDGHDGRGDLFGVDHRDEAEEVGRVAALHFDGRPETLKKRTRI